MHKRGLDQNTEGKKDFLLPYIGRQLWKGISWASKMSTQTICNYLALPYDNTFHFIFSGETFIQKGDIKVVLTVLIMSLSKTFY